MDKEDKDEVTKYLNAVIDSGKKSSDWYYRNIASSATLIEKNRNEVEELQMLLNLITNDETIKKSITFYGKTMEEYLRPKMEILEKKMDREKGSIEEMTKAISGVAVNIAESKQTYEKIELVLEFCEELIENEQKEKENKAKGACKDKCCG